MPYGSRCHVPSHRYSNHSESLACSELCGVLCHACIIRSACSRSNPAERIWCAVRKVHSVYNDGPAVRVHPRIMLPLAQEKTLREGSAAPAALQVATRRTRTAGKVEIPNVDDHVGKLEHMGKETVKKLQDIHGAGRSSGIDISVPSNCINKGARLHTPTCRTQSDAGMRR